MSETGIPVTCRAAGPEDEPFLRELYAVCRAPEFAALQLESAVLCALLDSQFRARYADYMGRFPDSQRFIIQQGDHPVGTYWIAAREELHLLDIAVLPDARGRGIAGSVIQRLQNEKPILLHVENTNLALRLYVRMGFRSIGKDEMYTAMRWDP